MTIHHVGAPRPRYNEKGRRASAAAAAASKKRAYEPEDDSNAAVIDPEQRKRRRADEATARAAEAVAAPPKMSSKKKKRLEAYISRKLKKDDRKDLIASLATTQTTNLSLRSSSALGSKQFTTQSSKLAHSQTVENSRRSRAQGLLKTVKGRGHHSASDSDGDSDDDDDDEALDLTADPIPRSTATLADRTPTPFNASGSLGVVTVEPAAGPVATTSFPPPTAPATVPATVGSGLGASVTVTVVKRKKKEKGRMRAMAGRQEKGKGRAVPDEDDSEFDSSDSAMDSHEDDAGSEAEAEGSDAESWHGIEDTAGGDARASSADEEDSDSDDEAPARPPREKGAFQAWAEAQVLSAAGLPAGLPKAPDPNSSSDAYVPALPAGSGFFNAPHPDGLTGPLGAVIPDAELPSLPPQRSTHIPVVRSPAMDAQRFP